MQWNPVNEHEMRNILYKINTVKSYKWIRDEKQLLNKRHDVLEKELLGKLKPLKYFCAKCCL